MIDNIKTGFLTAAGIIFIMGTLMVAATIARGEVGDLGQVFTMSNRPAGNEVLVFDRDSLGNLTQTGTFPTEGLGTGGS